MTGRMRAKIMVFLSMLMHITAFAADTLGSKESSIPAQELRLYLRSYLDEPSIKAFLDTIAYAEGTYKAGLQGYRVRYPQTMFLNYADHPKTVKCKLSRGKQLCSSASGRYMFLTKTWERIQKALDLKDFGPLSQDLGAVYLLLEENVLDVILAEQFEEAIYGTNSVWASFPDSPYGQPVKKMDELKSFFSDRLNHYRKTARKNTRRSP